MYLRRRVRNLLGRALGSVWVSETLNFEVPQFVRTLRVFNGLERLELSPLKFPKGSSKGLEKGVGNSSVRGVRSGMGP